MFFYLKIVFFQECHFFIKKKRLRQHSSRREMVLIIFSGMQFFVKKAPAATLQSEGNGFDHLFQECHFSPPKKKPAATLQSEGNGFNKNHSFPVKPFLPSLSCPVFPAKYFLSSLSCQVFPVKSFLPSPSCQVFPIKSFLQRLFYQAFPVKFFFFPNKKKTKLFDFFKLRSGPGGSFWIQSLVFLSW